MTTTPHPSAHRFPTDSDEPVVLGYYADRPNALPLPPERIPYALFTHLAHAFARVTMEGELLLPDPEVTRRLCDHAHTAGVKTLLALGGADSNPTLTRACATPDGVPRLADALARAVRIAGYDGMDMDWEAGENQGDRDRMNALTAAVRERLPVDATLTMAVPASDHNGNWFEPDVLLPLIDYFKVMAYDFHGPWSDHAGHNAPPFAPAPGTDKPECQRLSAEGAVGYWSVTKKVPEERILLGLPLYGRGFRAARFGDPASGEYERSAVTNREIGALLAAGWRKEYDREDTKARVPYLVSPDGAEVLSYDDSERAYRKGGIAWKQGLAGVFFWEISQDLFSTEGGEDERDFASIRAGYPAPYSRARHGDVGDGFFDTMMRRELLRGAGTV